MKYAFILLFGILLFVACKKKSPQSSLYQCVILDSIPPAPNAYDTVYTTLTGSQINDYVIQNTFIDTLNFNGVKRVQYQTATCQVY